MSESALPGSRPLTAAEIAEHWPTDDPAELYANGWEQVPDIDAGGLSVWGCWIRRD